MSPNIASLARLAQLAEQFDHDGAEQVLRSYLRLHELTGQTVSQHWLAAAVDRVAAGESETDVMADYGYVRVMP